MPFDEDARARAIPVSEMTRPLELGVADRRLVERLALRLGLSEADVVRVALQTLDSPQRGRRW